MNTNSSTEPSPRSLKIVVIGGTGLIGSKVVSKLRACGHDVIAASPSSGVNTLTREGLAETLAGTQVVVDVANSPSFEDSAVLDFFQTAGRNIAAAETAAGVTHHVALSVVGTERLQASGYFRAKLVQENLIQGSKVPYTIVRATQFFEFVAAIAQGSTTPDGSVRLSPALFQPIAAEDVVQAVADAALAAPVNGIVEVGGPEKVSLSGLIRKHLAATGDTREVIDDPEAGYFGTKIDDHSLTAGDKARIGAIHFDDWARQSLALK